MQALQEMTGLVLRALGDLLRQPDTLIVTVIVVFIVYGQYARIAKTEVRLFGAERHNPREQTINSLLAGVVGGVFATTLFVFVGVPLSGTGVWYLWVLALLLAFVHPRFMCFSYAGGLLSLVDLVWHIPGVNVPAIVALVAALHLVEAVLIATTGAVGNTPVYARFHTGRIVGGFLLQRFWPIPFAALIAGLAAPEALSLASNISMPNWWPLIRPGLISLTGREIVYGVLPVVAALGYTDLALTCTPVHKARNTAVSLIAYSIALLALAAVAQHSLIWAWVAAIFSPLGHEWVISHGRKQELWGKPLFVPEQGVMVLDVMPGGAAQRMGLKTGDLIYSVNNELVHSKADLAIAIAPWVIGVQVKVRSVLNGEERTLEYAGKIPPLGAVLAPEPGEPFHMDPYYSHGLLHQLWQRITRGLKGRSV